MWKTIIGFLTTLVIINISHDPAGEGALKFAKFDIYNSVNKLSFSDIDAIEKTHS